MKIISCSIGLVVLLLIDLGGADPDPDPVAPDARKARHPSSGPTSYNSLSVSDGETLSKLQNQVAPSVQIPLKPTKTSEAPQSPYGGTPNQYVNPHAPTTQTLPGQYYVAMATPHATGNQVLGPAATPLIMQYINPQGQPTGGIQYILLQRPLVYPYGPSTQYVQPSYVTAQHSQQPSAPLTHHYNPHSLSPYSHHPAGPSPTSPPNAASSTTQSSFVPFQPSSLQQYGTVAGVATTANHYAAHPQHHPHLPAPAAYTAGPVAQYSSPVLSYFPPRISLINGPGDMNLNTNEYMPNPGDHVFIKGVKTIRA